MPHSTLNTREQFAAIVAVVKAVKCPSLGKKAVQKLIYLLEKEIGFNLGYEFKFYTHGVFSRDLAGDMDVMKSMRLLDIRYDEVSEAYRIDLGPDANKFIEKGFERVEIDKIEKLSLRYSCLPAWKLEIALTAVYAQLEESVTDDKLCERVLELKPKFSAREVFNVLTETDHLRR